jgi:hypothetical protein
VASRTAGLWAAVERIGLPAWFVGWDVTIVARLLWPHSVGIDGNLYSVATHAWLTGGDPWGVFDGNRLAAPPPTLLPFVLTAWLPGGIAGFVWVGVAAVAAVVAIRQLGLPLWWLFFPPLVVAIWHGSIEPVVLLLLVTGPRALATVLKLYAALPLIGESRWRDLVVAGAILLATAPFLPWALYLGHWNDVQSALREEGFGIADASPSIVSVFTVGALAILGRRRAGYLAVPSLWPSAHFHYATVTIPVLASVPLVAAGASMVGSPVAINVAIIATAVLISLGKTRRGEPATAPASGWRAWVVDRWRGGESVPPNRGP